MKHISYGVIPIFKDEEGYQYLLLQNQGGYWGFPKGHVEAGESPKETAVREAYEETGIKVNINDLAFSVSYSYEQPIDNKMQTKQIVLFPAVVASQKVAIQNSEIRSHEWVTYDKAISLVDLPDFAQALREVENHSKNSEIV
jgi:bis(5'-nucleosidyl)-tetraphosphatase